MVKPIARAAPSGKRLAPVDPNGLDDWTASAPLILQAVPAGHPAGLYSFSIAFYTLVNPASGTLTITGSWSAPTVGPQSITFTAGTPLVNGSFIAPRHFMSDGALPIIITFTPAALVGVPRIYINAPADFILALFPEDFP